MRVLQSHKRGEVKRLGIGLESGGQSALQVSERPCIIYENDERYQLDATIMIYYHK